MTVETCWMEGKGQFENELAFDISLLMKVTNIFDYRHEKLTEYSVEPLCAERSAYVRDISPCGQCYRGHLRIRPGHGKKVLQRCI